MRVKPITDDKSILDLFGDRPASSCKQTPLYYAVKLLRALRVSELEYFRAYGNRPDRAHREVLIAELKATVVEALGNGSYATNPNVRPIETWLRTHNAISPPIQARLLTRAIENAYLLNFPDQLRRYYEDQVDPEDPTSFLVSPGDPVPVCDSIFGVDASPETNPGTNPRNLPRWRSPDRLSSIVLAPAWASRVDLRLNFSLRDDLRKLERSPLRVATIHPARDVRSDFTWDGHDDFFENVRPNSQEVIDRIYEGIEVAEGEKARLIVLPELCSSFDVQETISKKWGAGGGGSDLLIAGSHHMPVPEEHCSKWLRGNYPRDQRSTAVA